MSSNLIERTEHGPVHELRLNRPPANALNRALIEALLGEVRSAPQRGAKALVISGRAGMFSGGLDVPELLGQPRAEMHALWKSFFALMEAIATSPAPVAAAITGHAPAGGCVIALFCDQRIMSEGRYRIGLNEVQVGLRMPRPILTAAQHVVGRRQAARMATTAELFTVEEALRIGLIDDAVAIDQVVPSAIAWGEKIAALPPIAMSKTRALARDEFQSTFRGLDEEQLELFLDEWFGDETQGAMGALVKALEERRKAKG
ncbi:MAG: 3,2-trans-enoyl-CoA isomerase [Planctomycetota bacterium]|jgi:3,2-trans-enoyl-CoA isomerase